MRSRLDLEPPSLIRYLTPAARLADAILRATFLEGGFPQALTRNPSLVVVHGVRVADASTLHAAAQDLLGGDEDDTYSLDATVRDWTDLTSVRPDRVERLLVEASVSTRTMIVFCRTRTEVPAVVGTVADALLPLASHGAPLAELVEEIGKFLPDDALVTRLANLPLSYLNLVVRPGMSRERMWSVAGRLRRTVRESDEAKQNPSDAKRRKARAAASPASAPTDGHPERLEDMPGMGEAQRWGLSLAADLARYRDGSLPWCDLENGVILHGPPGTGKTLFARALAGSCGVPLFSHSFASWQAKGHLGDLLKALRAAFDEARKAAPCVLFVDELDSVGSRDEPLGDNTAYQRQVVNGFLECLDGAVGRGGVVVVGATNKLDAIDPAILRPGRLGRIVEVQLPDLLGRVGIVRHHLRGDLAEVDLSGLADESGEVSGAVLAQLVREARAAARRESRPLTEADLWAAVPKGTELSEASFRRVCVHEAGHLVVGLELSAVSGLIPTGASVRGHLRHGRENKTDFRVVEGVDRTRECVEATLMVFLAGMAAEEVILGSRGDVSGGSAEADLVRATRLARSAEQSLGLGERLSSVPKDAAATSADDPDLSRRVERLLVRCLTEAKLVVERRRVDIERVAAQLFEAKKFDLEDGTVSPDDSVAPP